MPTYRRQTRIDAPLAVVWELHATVAGLVAVTPEWLRLDVEAVRGPNGDPSVSEFDVGSQVRLSIRPFGVGPRLRWLSRIVELEVREGAAYFRDEMADGPFDRWIHTHTFFADGDETILIDEVEYRLPFGVVGEAAGPLAKVGFEATFRQRHADTKALLDGRAELPIQLRS